MKIKKNQQKFEKRLEEEEKSTFRAFASRAKNSVEKQKVLILSFKDYLNISNFENFYFEIFFSPFLFFLA